MPARKRVCDVVSDVSMFVGGWCKAGHRASLPVINPATEETIGEFPRASTGDMDRAVIVIDRRYGASGQ